MIINDLVNPVLGKVRQRTEMMPYFPHYIAQAILDLTENIEFEDLKIIGPLTNFVPNIAEYPMAGYDPLGINGNPFINATDHRLTFIDSWFVYFDPSGVITSGQSTGKVMDKRDLRVVEPMSKVLGIPTVYTTHGTNKSRGKIIVGMMPDNPYACQMRYQREHPFAIEKGDVQKAQGDATLAARLGSSIIYMPDDWAEILILAAAEKVCDDIGLNEISQAYHQKLFGYKDKRGNEFPGIITVRQTAQERNSIFNSRQLRPVVRRYT